MFYSNKHPEPLKQGWIFSRTTQVVFGWFVLCLLTACNVTKHLDTAKGEHLLVANSLELKAERKLNFAERAPLMYQLEGYYKQKPNQRAFGLFRTRLWFYYKYHDRNTKFAKWATSRIAEPPTIYEEDLARKTALNFENQMRQRGYFNAVASFDTDTINQYKVKTKYNLILGPLYHIDSIFFESRDSLVEQVMHLTEGETLLHRGDAVDGLVFEAERLRITSALKNRGYAFFTPNFVEFTGDTTGLRTNVTVEVLLPGDSMMHKTYTIGKIAVFSSLLPDVSFIRKDTTINGIYFASADPKFQVKPERLYNAIALQPSWPYRQIDFDKTTHNLNALGVFRFVTVKPSQDSIQPDKINVAISFRPNKRLPIGGGVELNSSTSPSLARNLLGVSSNLSFTNRNLFRGAEHLQSNVQYNIEFGVGERRFIFSNEVKFLNELVFPRFFDYFGFWRSMHGMRFGQKRILPTALYNRMKADGQARYSLNYNYLNVTDFFAYNLINTSFGYDIRSSPEHQYNIDQVGIDVLRLIDTLKVSNEFLKRSFSNQLFTGFVLRAFNYNYAGQANRFGERWAFRFNSDLSGLEELAINRLWSIPFGKQTWTLGGLNFAQYLRLDLDATYTREFRKDLIGALRVGSGVIVPYGDTKDAPYVKQFFVGGPSSLRAWRIRQLGPGGYNDSKAIQPYYQAGDFRFEFNGELRFPLIWWLKGAVFLDGGNIWTIRPDSLRPGSQLRWDSYKNIALGTGVGIRGDFSYFVIRVDFGLPLRWPFRQDESGSYWALNKFTRLQWKDFNPNLAVGYPF
ncbi:MAG TPA: BamA/TamA family outer membrane protein [Saprospiraceae bacterium]|nr:BamA/TamA family outer membrane protein [Saprospiraceae bacterium]